MLTSYRSSQISLRDSSLSELPDDVIWIDLLNPTEEERAFVESRGNIRVPSIEALSEIESSSRLVFERNVIYLSTPLVAQSDTPDPFLSPAGFVLSSKLLVTIRFAELSAFAVIAAQIRGDESVCTSAVCLLFCWRLSSIAPPTCWNALEKTSIKFRSRCFGVIRIEECTPSVRTRDCA